MGEQIQALQNFIGGQFVPCTRHIDSYNPATGKVIFKVPDSGKEEVDKSVEAAKTAFKRY